MTVRNYLKKNTADLIKCDQYPKASEFNIRKGLAAYAMCIYKGIDGYSAEDIEVLLEECGCDSNFIDKCETFVSHSCEFLNLIRRLPNLEDLND